MKAGKSASEAMKEKASNAAASARAAMEKTKATAQEKVRHCIFFFGFRARLKDTSSSVIICLPALSFVFDSLCRRRG